MNKQRREHIREVISRINSIGDDIESLLEDIQNIKDEETDYRDNIPENLQGSERYETSDHACNELEAAYETFEESKDSLECVVEALESAIE